MNTDAMNEIENIKKFIESANSVLPTNFSVSLDKIVTHSSETMYGEPRFICILHHRRGQNGAKDHNLCYGKNLDEIWEKFHNFWLPRFYKRLDNLHTNNFSVLCLF